MDSFLKLLENAAEYIINQEDLSYINSGEAFEKYVVDIMKELAKDDSELPSEGAIEQTGASTFPDIVIGSKFGVEVKFSRSGKWDSLGNSIFESTSVRGLEEIYLLFGRKVDNKIEVRFKPYEESLTDVKVTHSPRFIVDMEAGSGSSIFHNLHISYDEFKGLDKVDKGKQIKAYFRSNLKEGQEVWFLDNEESQTEVTVSSFSSLENDDIKNKLLIEAYILFPEVFSASTSKYAGVSTYWLTKYQVYNSALRDKFSASGREVIDFPELGQITVKKIYKNLYRLSKQIQTYIANADISFIELVIEKWQVSPEEVDNSNLLGKWLELIDVTGVNPSVDMEEIKPSDVFNAGLL